MCLRSFRTRSKAKLRARTKKKKKMNLTIWAKPTQAGIQASQRLHYVIYMIKQRLGQRPGQAPRSGYGLSKDTWKGSCQIQERFTLSGALGTAHMEEITDDACCWEFYFCTTPISHSPEMNWWIRLYSLWIYLPRMKSIFFLAEEAAPRSPVNIRVLLGGRDRGAAGRERSLLPSGDAESAGRMRPQKQKEAHAPLLW